MLALAEILDVVCEFIRLAGIVVGVVFTYTGLKNHEQTAIIMGIGNLVMWGQTFLYNVSAKTEKQVKEMLNNIRQTKCPHCGKKLIHNEEAD